MKIVETINFDRDVEVEIEAEDIAWEMVSDEKFFKEMEDELLSQGYILVKENVNEFIWGEETERVQYLVCLPRFNGQINFRH